MCTVVFVFFFKRFFFFTVKRSVSVSALYLIAFRYWTVHKRSKLVAHTSYLTEQQQASNIYCLTSSLCVDGLLRGTASDCEEIIRFRVLWSDRMRKLRLMRLAE